MCALVGGIHLDGNARLNRINWNGRQAGPTLRIPLLSRSLLSRRGSRGVIDLSGLFETLKVLDVLRARSDPQQLRITTVWVLKCHIGRFAVVGIDQNDGKGPLTQIGQCVIETCEPKRCPHTVGGGARGGGGCAIESP